MLGRRTWLALACTTAALAVPGAAWWIVGSREVAREAAALRAAPRAEAQARADRLADRLAARLEALRRAESERPFAHYQNLYHDPRGAAEGVAVIPSPLADGPTDPLVEAYFQIEPDGKVSLPTLNDENPAANFRPDVGKQREIQARLQPIAATCSAAGQEAAQLDAAQVEAQIRQVDAGPQEDAVPPGQAPDNRNVKVQTLAAEAWTQNAEANGIYAALRSGKGLPAQVQARGKDGPDQTVQIATGELAWATIPVDQGPALAALRWVRTPRGVLTQGFTVARAAAEAEFGDGAGAGRLLAGAPAGDAATALALPGVEWHVAVVAGPAMAAADARAAGLQGTFRRTFAAGAVAAALLGLWVVGLVWHTERLASQRAQFAAAAAHELRTPLAGLRMYGEMLAEGLGDPAKRTDYARRVSEEADRLGRVVSNVLEFTRLERGTLHVDPRPGDLGRAVRDAVARVAPTLEAAGCPCTVQCAAELPTAVFDPDALAQILGNLLDNAEKYTRGNSRRGTRIAVAATAAGAAIAVSDNGPGVPAVLRRRLFRPFARGADPDAPAGLGLGLALTKALVEAQGGTIAYADTPGGGATFTIGFPAIAFPAVTGSAGPETR